MLLPLLLVAADPETAIDAERAFNAAAQAEGQWTAFRKFAAADATMFVPEPTNAQVWLKDRKDPPKSVEWAPAENFVSCDGKTAVNTGPWKRPDSVGYFTTVWQRQDDGHFKWLVDGGDTLAKPLERPAEPVIHRASCSGEPEPFGLIPTAGVKYGEGASPDRTLIWIWSVQADGARHFQVVLWNGDHYAETLNQTVAAPK